MQCVRWTTAFSSYFRHFLLLKKQPAPRRKANSRASFPDTRYQGSKSRLIPFLESEFSRLSFDTALDIFGGTGVVSHLLKRMGKAVTINDILKSNHAVGRALIENSHASVANDEVEWLCSHIPSEFPTFINDTFSGIYFTDEENLWLDRVLNNLNQIRGYKKDMLFFGLMQACMAKRPYNLFHRANLYMRKADVVRSFGNKSTWDKPFRDHMTRYCQEANLAVFDNDHECHSLNKDCFDIAKSDFDLVYFDPPYVSPKGVGVDYRGFYHFLEGMLHYEDWGNNIDWASKHLRLKPQHSPWTRPKEFLPAMKRLWAMFPDSTLVMSYRSPGQPSVEQLKAAMLEVRRNVQMKQTSLKYALSGRGIKSTEILLIGSNEDL